MDLGHPPLGVLVVVDMEGISGINHWHQVTGGFQEFEQHGRIQVTGDVNAAIRGLKAAGVNKIRVVDNHGSGGPSQNVIPEKLEQGAELYNGPNIVTRLGEAADETMNAAVFLGFHAMADTPDAFMPHTRTIEPRIRINGEPVGETAITAYFLGERNIPVIMATGDQALAREAQAALPGIEVAQVKTSTRKNTSGCLPPELARGRIQEAAMRSVSRIREMKPLVAKRPITVQISYLTKDETDLVDGMPGSRRIDPNTLSYTTDQWNNVEDFINTASRLVSQIRIRKLLRAMSKLEGVSQIQEELIKKDIDEWLK